MTDKPTNAELRAQHTCIMAASSMHCRTCARGVPYPALTTEEIAEALRQGHEEAEAAVRALFGRPAVPRPRKASMTTDERPSIAELQRVLNAMNDQPPWRQGQVERDRISVRDPEGLAGPVLGERVVMRANRYFPHEANAAAVVALVNTGPVLHEIVAKALAWKAALDRIRSAADADRFREQLQRQAELEAALGKIRP